MVHVYVPGACPRPQCMSMSIVHVHDACPCTWCMSMSIMQVHVDGVCPCPCCMSISALHVLFHAARQFLAAWWCLCSCWMSKFMPNLHLHDICPLLMLHVHVHVQDTCPYPCCTSMSMLYDHSVFMLHVHVHAACLFCVHAACPCPCCMYKTMIQSSLACNERRTLLLLLYSMPIVISWCSNLTFVSATAGRVAEPKLFYAAPAPTSKKFRLRLRSRNQLRLWLQLEPVELTQFKL